MQISNWLFRASGLISFLALLAHEFIGAPMVLTPLAGTDISPEVIWLHHFSWHVGSVAVAAMVAMYVYVSLRPGNLALAVVATSMSAGFAGLGISLGVWGNDVIWSTPAPYVWSVVAILGAVGIWTSNERSVMRREAP